MTPQNIIQLFEPKKVRTVWEESQKKWDFSVVDVAKVTTDGVNPTDYVKNMKKRDPILAQGWGQIVIPSLFKFILRIMPRV